MSIVMIGWGVTMTNPANQIRRIGLGLIFGGGVISIRNARRGVAGIGVTENGLVLRWDEIAEVKLYPNTPCPLSGR
jgi:hypothetical protein